MLGRKLFTQRWKADIRGENLLAVSHSIYFLTLPAVPSQNASWAVGGGHFFVSVSFDLITADRVNNHNHNFL